MIHSSSEIIFISSDEDTDGRGDHLSSSSKKKPSFKSSVKNDVSADDCLILDGDPDKPVKVSNERGNESDELLVVAEKGQIACRDYPHARHMCARYPFLTNPHEKYCNLCHCYVCDTKAPCVYWGTGKSSGDHCHSTDKEETWSAQRKHIKQERDVLLGLKSLSLDRSPVQSAKSTGFVKSFNSFRGYGFIAPDGGGEKLFVHRSSIKRECQSLVEGERVEFRIESRDLGSNEAIDVTTPGGSDARGSTAMVRAKKFTGTVKWFSFGRCYGFITLDIGGEDLFFHQSSIKSPNVSYLGEGEKVEFQIERDGEGRNRAIDVQRTTGRGNYTGGFRGRGGRSRGGGYGGRSSGRCCAFDVDGKLICF